MKIWTDDELSTVGQAEELQVTSRRSDGTLRPYVTIWVVRAGDGLYIRSAYGSTNPWFRRARAAGTVASGSAVSNVTSRLRTPPRM